MSELTEFVKLGNSIKNGLYDMGFDAVDCGETNRIKFTVLANKTSSVGIVGYLSVDGSEERYEIFVEKNSLVPDIKSEISQLDGFDIEIKVIEMPESDV